MKKILTLVAATIITATSFSQTSKGNWMVGGNAGFTSTSQGSGNSVSTITIAPSAGYFFMDNFAGGLSVDFTTISNDGGSSFNVGPMARYYFTELSKTAKLFGQAEFGFGSTTPSGVGAKSVSSTQWGLNAGAAIFLNKNVALEGALGYSSLKWDGATDSRNTFGVNFGFQIHL